MITTMAAIAAMRTEQSITAEEGRLWNTHPIRNLHIPK